MVLVQAPAPAGRWGSLPSVATSLRSVDWANRNYGRHLRLRNGRYTLRRYPARHNPLSRRCRHTTESARLVKVHYADLTDDGAPVAVVELFTYRNYCAGRAYRGRVLVVFARRAGRVLERGRISLINVDKVKVDKRGIHVERRGWKGNKSNKCNDTWILRNDKVKRRRSICRPHP